MDGVDEEDRIGCIAVSIRDVWDNRGGRLTRSLDVKAVEGSSCVCNVIHPLMDGRSQFRRLREKEKYIAPSRVETPSYGSP
jgi:hypothetical protein